MEEFWYVLSIIIYATLPAEYPYKPPHIIFLTKSGRFEINTKVCLSFSAYHPELWQPAWGIRLILEALISFLPTKGDGAIGSLDWSPKERQRLAKESHNYCCPQCGPIVKLLPLLNPEEKKKKQLMDSNSKQKKKGGTFAKEIAELQRLQQVTEQGRTNNKSKEKKKDADKEGTTPTTPTISSSNTATAKKKEEEQNKDVVVSEEKKKKESSSSSSSSPAATVVEEHECNLTTSTAATATATVGGDGGGATTGLELEMNNDNGGVNVNVNNNNTTNTTTTISWMYDPLLNITILLMCFIIVLFAKKGWDLSYELQELRKLPIVDTVLSGGGSAAAAASSSEEL